MRWPGFRKVRRMVCHRVDTRLRALGLGDVAAYRAYLEVTPNERRILDGLCSIPGEPEDTPWFRGDLAM